MTNNLPLFEGLNVRILIIIPSEERGFINQGSGLGICSTTNANNNKNETKSINQLYQ